MMIDCEGRRREEETQTACEASERFLRTGL